MYNIRQFKPMLYVLLMLGMIAFALAAQSPGVFLGAFFMIAINAWLVKTKRFTPLPRWLANAITLAGFGFCYLQVRAGVNATIILIAQFLVFLQIVKLYEQRGNRDYAQLLVLSLLLVVAAAISTASLAFGVVLVIYLFLSLYCCLLFHLKVETDHAREAYSLPEKKPNEATLLQDQRFLSSSMRRLTGLVSAVAVTCAVFVFLFFPRGTGAGLLNPLQFKASQALTGFQDQVSFQNIARIQQNTEEVGTVRVTKNGEAISQIPLLLRGTTLDIYSGGSPRQGDPWTWSRSRLRDEDNARNLAKDQMDWFTEQQYEHPIMQDIQMKPTGTSVMFGIPGIIGVQPGRDMQVRFNQRDGVLQSATPIVQELRYKVISTGTVSAVRPLSLDAAALAFGLATEPESRSIIDEKIREYARRPEVGGANVDKRGTDSRPSPLDDEIASNIERHLRTEFTYTLDLTDTRRIEGQDPMVAFLYDFKKGHCEYFAGAMTLMCQSLKMNARMVVGFKCDEYNTYGKFFTVRQSHAHAWVEVLTTEGWKTFDPTSGRDNGTSVAEQSMWTRFKSFFNFLEFSWAQSVIAYDNDNRTNLIAQMESKMTNSAIQGYSAFSDFKKWLNPNLSLQLINLLMAGMGLVVLVAVGWFIRERWRLRRRAARIGIQSLPTSDQLRLARQLGFYDDLLQILAKHQIHRPPHLTPLEFSHTLSYLPSEIFDMIQRLTGIFYRIRYGHTKLTSAQQRHLSNVITHMQEIMAPKPVKAVTPDPHH